MAKPVSARSFLVTAAVWLLVWGVLAADGPFDSAQDLDARVRKIRALLDDGRYQEGEAEAQSVYPIFEEGSVEQSADPSPADLLVEALVRNGRGAETRTREVAQRVIRDKTSRFGSTHPVLAPSLRNLGDVLFESGEYGPAVASFRDVVARRERMSDAPASDRADDLDHLTRALMEAGQYDEALVISGRALAIREEHASARKDIALARTLRLRGAAHQRKNQIAEARRALERALALLEVSNPKHPETAMTLRLLGVQLTTEGDLLGGREILTRALSLAGEALPPEHPDRAALMASLAANLQELGNLAESRTLREQAVEIVERVFGSDHPVLATRINDLANVCLLQGEYATAVRLYERAGDIYRRRLGPDHLGVSTALFNLALVHTSLGDFNEARRELNAVIATWERVLGPNDSNVARAVSALANLLADQGLDREAQPYFERALAIRERNLAPNHPYIAWTLGQRAESLARLGQLPRALALAERAVKICESSGAQESLAAAVTTHARILATSGDHAGAAQAYQKSLEIRLQLLGPSHPRIAEIEIALAGVQSTTPGRSECVLRGAARRRDQPQPFTAHPRVSLRTPGAGLRL